MKTRETDETELIPQSLQLSDAEAPAGVDRRAFLMRSALVGAVAVLNGCSPATPPAGTPPAAAPTPAAAPQGAVSPDLDVVKKAKGPVMTVIDEFYKVGPGPSSSHTIGPMRITYDFYQRATKLPADQLAKATALKVHLFGSLSATGIGHGTERASLAGIIGKEPATIDPAFLDDLRDRPDQSFPVKLGSASFNVSLKDVIYDAPKGTFPHPNTMTCKLMAGDTVLLEQEYYSVGGGFIEWKGYTPPKKGAPKYPYATMAELLKHADTAKITVAQLAMANEVAVSGKSEAEINAFIDKITTAMVNIVKTGLKGPSITLPGPIKLQTKAADVYARAIDDRYEAQRGIGVVSAYALAGSEENARGHLVVTAPTGGSAGVMPALVYAVGEGGRKLSQDKIRAGMLAAAAVGYLCKHNATLSGAEGGCQAEIGVASAMGAAFLAQAHDMPNQVVANAAEASLQHHLGHDVRPGRGLRAGAVHRALRVWRGQGVDRLHDRQQRDPGQPARRLRHHGECDGAHRQGDELEVQGDL